MDHIDGCLYIYGVELPFLVIYLILYLKMLFQCLTLNNYFLILLKKLLPIHNIVFKVIYL